MNNLAERVKQECNTLKELLKMYEQQKTSSSFGITFLKKLIETTEKALARNDVQKLMEVSEIIKSIRGFVTSINNLKTK